MPLVSTIASTESQCADETLISIAASMEHLLALHTQMQHDISQLVAGQADTQSAIVELAAQGAATTESIIAKKEPVAKQTTPSSFLFSSEEPEPTLPTVSSHASVSATQSSSLRLVHTLNMVSDVAANSAINQDELDHVLNGLKETGSNLVTGRKKRSTRVSELAFESQSSLPFFSHLPALCSLEPRRRGYILDPHCRLRICHDLCSILVLAIDIVTSLVVLAWNFEVTGAVFVINMTSMSFWIWDMLLSFATGVYVQGELRSRPKEVAKRYLKSWFVSDLVIIAADVLTLSLEVGMGNSAGVLRLSKATRFLRLMRLARLAKTSDAIGRLVDANVYIEVGVGALKPILIVLMINHMLACAWWSIGSYLPSDTGRRWIDGGTSTGIEVPYRDASFSYQYLTCAHWSLTQLSVGTMDVTPVNSYERAFNCFSLILGLLVFSTLISTVSAKMIQHYFAQRDKLTEFAALRRFLKKHLKPGTAIAANFQAQKAALGTSVRPTTVNDLAAFAVLPQALRRIIRVELCEKDLRHPLFRWWFLVDPEGAITICHRAIEFIGLAAEDHLFFPRASAKGAYVLTSGAARYVLDSQRRLEIPEVEVCEGLLFCEVALWCKWKHIGELVATRGCELLSIRAAALFRCSSQVEVVRHMLVQYGRSFYFRAVEMQQVKPSSDLSVAFTDFASLLPTLPVECRQLIGAVAVNVAKHRHAWKGLTDSIAEEVHEGTASLMVNSEGDVERVESIVVLRLSRADGRILVRLGARRDEASDGIEAMCELPSEAINELATPTQAFARLFQGALAPFAENIDVIGVELEETVEASRETGMKTKLLKIVKVAELELAVEDLGLEDTLIKLPGIRSRFSKSLSNMSNNMSVSGGFASMSPWLFSRTSTRATGGLAFGPGAGLDNIGDISMYVLADEAGRTTFVAWLTSEELHYCRSPAGKAVVQAMLEKVDLEPEMVSIAMARFIASQSCHQHDSPLDVPEAFAATADELEFGFV